MARQEQIFAQTITDMKRAMLRKNDDSESDDLIDKPTNRGNKLKRKAKFVEEGRLDLANSVQAYRKKINYNGFFREIISKNPVRVDPDGDVVDDDDEDDDSAAGIERLEDDPYKDVKIEQLLMPLTSAAELNDHPSLSMPYKCKILDEMVQNAQDMLFREEDALWRIKQLTNEFRGDSTWMPCGNFQTANDISLLGRTTARPSAEPSIVAEGETMLPPSTNWDALSSAQLMADLEEAAHNESQQPDHFDASIATMDYVTRDANEAPTPKKQLEISTGEPMEDALPDDEKVSSRIDIANGDGETEGTEDVSNGVESHVNGDSAQKPPKQEEDVENPPNDHEIESAKGDQDPPSFQEPRINGETNHQPNDDEDQDDEADEDEASQPQHRMTTRAKAQAASSPDPNSPSSPANGMQFIHPFFIPPQTSLSTREAGLPYDEADETRRLVCAYVQKQEEVCRGASRLYYGLLRAKKMRDDVLEWCRAEGHIGEMSDGEDWYDMEKWNLTEDLKKGEEMDEEEANVTGKKTRHRRTARDA